MHQPPKWADRFLSWYCNPDLLEEIQGDAYERRYISGKEKIYLGCHQVLQVVKY
uniref:permease prefix domain 2-containing transporter n=1 Tax=Fulvivirga sp. TaxID=1931237 RepID=UPI00404930ED